MGVGAANEIVVPPGKTVVGADSFYKNTKTGQESKPFPCFNACGKKKPSKVSTSICIYLQLCTLKQ